MSGYDDGGGDSCRMYEVEPGDTFYSIAHEFACPLQAIHDANPNLDVERLQVGMRVCVPTSGWGGGEGDGDEGLPPHYAVNYHNLEPAQPSSSSAHDDDYDHVHVVIVEDDEPRLSSPTRRSEVASLSLALASGPSVSATASGNASSSSSSSSVAGGATQQANNRSKLISASQKPARARSKTAAQRHKRRNEDREKLKLPAAQTLKPETHEVADGDTLNLISSVYGVPVAIIQRLNDLHPDSIIYPGEVLRVPSPLHATTHTVAPGDSLNLIAEVHDVPVEAIQALNGLKPDSIIYPGTVLRVASPHVHRNVHRKGRKGGKNAADKKDKKNAAARSAAVGSGSVSGYYAPVMASGAPVPTAAGTIRSFARRVMQFLPNAPDHLIRGAVAAVRTVAGATQAPRWRPNFIDRERPADGLVVVGRGESLASVAQDNGLSIRALQKMNGITSDMVEPGEVLRVSHLSAAERKPHLRRRTKRHLFQRTATATGAESNDDTGGGGDGGGGGGGGARAASRRLEKADAGWRRWKWRWEPRGCDADVFFSRRSGLGRGLKNNEDGTGGEVEAAKATAAAALGKDTEGKLIIEGLSDDALKPKPARIFAWEHRRRPRDQTHAWHPKFGNPVVDNNPFVSSGFGKRWERMHTGVDIAANEGTPVRAAAAGVVKERSYDENGYGWLLKVDHGDGWETRYAHCWEISARPGQKLRAGQVVASVGNTGRSFGPHLHFEVRRGGEAIDPLTCTAT